MEAFHCKSKFLLFVQIFLIIVGHYSINHDTILGCSSDGLSWVYQTEVGTIFGSLYKVMVLMQILTAEIVLYGIPKKYGWFEKMKDGFKRMGQEKV